MLEKEKEAEKSHILWVVAKFPPEISLFSAVNFIL